MSHAILAELRKLYSRWTTMSPFPLIAAVLALVAWNVDQRGASMGLAPSIWGIAIFAPLMWWLPAVFAIVTAAGALGGEFEQGTARTTLMTPLSRGRLLFAKFVACQVHAVAIVAFTGVLACALTWVLFGEIRMPLYAGTEVGMSVLAPGHYYPAQLEQAPAVARLAWVYAWLLAEVTALVAVTLFVGAAVRHAVAAMSVTTAVVVLMWVMSSVEALEPVRPVLLVAQTVGWIWVASAIVPWNQIVTGLACMVGYTVVGLAGAWALLEMRDIDV